MCSLLLGGKHRIWRIEHLPSGHVGINPHFSILYCVFVVINYKIKVYLKYIMVVLLVSIWLCDTYATDFVQP